MGDNQFQHHTKSWHTVLCDFGQPFLCRQIWGNQFIGEWILPPSLSCEAVPAVTLPFRPWRIESDSSHLHVTPWCLMNRCEKTMIVGGVCGVARWVSKKYRGNQACSYCWRCLAGSYEKMFEATLLLHCGSWIQLHYVYFFLKKPNVNGEHASLIRVWFVGFRNLLIDCKLIMNSGLTSKFATS